MHPPVKEKVTVFFRRSKIRLVIYKRQKGYFIFASQIPILQLFDLFRFGYDTKFGPIDRIKLVTLKNIEI